MKNCFPIVFFATFFCIIFFTTKAQEPNLYVEHFGIEEGLSQNAVNCFLQDSKGFIWIGTQDGLNQYNGKQFKIFRYDPNDPNSISNNLIQAIEEDHKGNLWVVTDDGLNLFMRSKGQFLKFTSPFINESNQYFYAIHIDRNDNIWLKGFNEVYRFQINTGKFSRFGYDMLNFSNVNRRSDIVEDRNGTIWITSNDGLLYFDKKTQDIVRLFHNKLDPQSLNSNEVRTVYEDFKGNLWVGTANGLNRYNREKKIFERFLYSERNHFIGVNAILEDYWGKIWVGTDDGLFLFDDLNNSLKAFDALSKIKNVTKLFNDKSNLIWVATQNELYKIDQTPRKIRHYLSNKNSIVESENYSIQSIYVDKQNITWLGTKNEGLIWFDTSTGQIVRQYTPQNPKYTIENGSVNVIFSDSKSNLWIGTDYGIELYNPDTQEFKNIKSDDSKEKITAIAEDYKGNMWFGTQGYGLYKYTNGNFQVYYRNDNDSNTVCSNVIHTIVEDEKHFLWIGTSNGLNRFDPQTQRFKAYRKTQNNPNSLSHNSVLSLYNASDSILWIGTETGLNKLNKLKDKITIYTQTKGELANNFIYSILGQSDGTIWISSNRGLSKFNPVEQKAYNYGLFDGIQGYEYNRGACFKTAKGEYFFGGVNGFNVFYPNSMSLNQYAPKIQITEVSYRQAKGDIVRQIIDNQSVVEIPHGVFDFRIEFAFLEFTHPQANTFQYRIKNKSDEWIQLGKKNYIEYTIITTGEYLFEIRGMNNDGISNAESTFVTVVVQSPFWLNWYAFVIYFLILVGIVYTVFLRITTNWRRASAMLREREKATHEIEIQREELAVKNTNITDSLHYAKKIIEAMMPSHKTFKKILPVSFVLSKPKDIVSGDFFWIAEKDDKIFVAAVDCTGHGVPGAFMSIIGFDLLRNITDEQEIENPAEILNQLNAGVAKTVGKDNENALRDGMDLVFCVIDRRRKEMQFAGAINPILIIRNGNVMEIRGNRHSVGLAAMMDKKTFTNYTIPLEEDDIVYMFSDGYLDQFGGSDGKKFKYRRFRYFLLSIHKEPLEQQKVLLEERMNEWMQGLEQVDDMLIIGFKPL